jgi:triacylglycerol lipase
VGHAPLRQPVTGRLARALQIVLVLEIGLLGFGLGWLCGRGTLSGMQWLAIAAGWYFGFRALATASNFLQTWWHRTPRAPEHRIGALATLRLLWGEYYTTLLAYSLLFPFEATLVPLAPQPATPGRGTPVVLVPGFACNRGYWLLFTRSLERAGFGPVYAVTLEPLLGSIESNAAQLARFVEAICAQTGAPKVALVGHSMGGLVARAWLHQADGSGAARIEQIVALGTPNRGTVLAQPLRGLGADLAQMSRDSAWSRALNEHEARPCPVPITAIITPHDNIVAPQASTYLRYPNARNVVLPGIGHLEMVLSVPVVLATIDALKAGGTVPIPATAVPA